MKEIANIWEYKVNAIIANFVYLSNCRMIARNFQLYPSEACVNLVVNFTPGHKKFFNEGDINFKMWYSFFSDPENDAWLWRCSKYEKKKKIRYIWMIFFAHGVEIDI